MKHIVILLLAINLSLFSFSQEKINEAILISKQTVDTDNEQMKAQLAMMGDITTTVYVKDKKTRAETKSPMTGDAIVIIDGKSNDMLMLMNNPAMGKMYMKQDLSLSNEDKAKLDVKKGDETKMVLGYECQQYFAKTNQRGVEVDMEFFTTEKIEGYTQNVAEFGDLIKGFPLYMEMTMNVPQMGGKTTITNEVTEIKKESVPDDKFDMTVPEGYKELPQQ